MERAQSYVERLPVPVLAGRVRTVWIQQTGPRAHPQRHLPTGGVEVSCSLGAVPRVLGPLTAARVQALPPYTTVVGVRFWPGAARTIVDLPAEDLVDATVRLDEVWGDQAIRLGELLAEAPSPDAALHVLQRHLVDMLDRQPRTDDRSPLVAEAVRRLMPWQPVEIGRLTAQLAISASQLRRRFLATVGVGPKTLQRTLRFQGYLALAQAAAAPDRVPGADRGGLADLAAAAGYADHAHLGRECRQLTGLTPRELLGGRDDRCGCGHDHAASYLPFLEGRVRRPQPA